jgi:N-acetylated-alpha-linked acidic dipeptidase
MHPFLYRLWVKTMPGIREGIEQRKWKEAQEQIEVDAKAIGRLSDYLMRITTVNK